MLHKKNEISLLYDLSEILAEELTMKESNNILSVISNIGKGNKKIQQIVDIMSNITSNVSLNDSVQHLEKCFNKNIQELKTIKELVNVAKKYSQEPKYLFQDDSLIPALEVLNIFFSKKVSIEDDLTYTIDEMLDRIKYNSKGLQRFFSNHIDKSCFKNDEQLLGNISFLRLYTFNIVYSIEQIREILEAPPRIKKTKKTNKKH